MVLDTGDTPAAIRLPEAIGIPAPTELPALELRASVLPATEVPAAAQLLEVAEKPVEAEQAATGVAFAAERLAPLPRDAAAVADRAAAEAVWERAQSLGPVAAAPAAGTKGASAAAVPEESRYRAPFPTHSAAEADRAAAEVVWEGSALLAPVALIAEAVDMVAKAVWERAGSPGPVAAKTGDASAAGLVKAERLAPAGSHAAAAAGDAVGDAPWVGAEIMALAAQDSSGGAEDALAGLAWGKAAGLVTAGADTAAAALLGAAEAAEVGGERGCRGWRRGGCIVRACGQSS